MQVAVMDHDEAEIETLHGPYLLGLVVDDEGNSSSYSASAGADGIARFAGLKCFGTLLTLTAQGDGFEPVVEVVDEIIGYHLEISDVPQDLQYYSKYFYEVSVLVESVSDYSREVAKDVVVSLLPGLAEGLTAASNSDGVATFNVFIETPGELSLLFSAESATLSKTVLGIASNNTVDQCKVAISPSECSVCVPNSVLVNSTCECVSISTYSSKSRSCVCPSGSKLIDSECYYCKNFIKSSELDAHYSKDFKSIFINFERAVDISQLDSCDKIITGPDSLLEALSSCVWISLQILQVSLKSTIGTSLDVVLDKNSVVAISGDCSYAPSNLQVNVQLIYAPLSLSTSIISPATYYTSCNYQSLTISSEYKSASVIYTWSSSAIPENPALSSYIQSINSDSFSISPSELSSGSLTISLNLSSSSFASSFSCSKTITILDSSTLTGYLNTGSNVEIKRNQELTLIAFAQSCALSPTFSYTWSADSIKASEFMLESRPNTLLIPQNSLQSGSSYNIQVTISDGSSSVAVSCLVTVKESELVLDLSRSSGSISLLIDFEAKATCYDPDDDLAVTSFDWFCIESNSECLGRQGKALNLVQNKNQLKVSSEELKDGSTYQIVAKCSTEKKIRYKQIEAVVDGQVRGDVSIRFTSFKVNPDYINSLIPVINFQGSLSFHWNIKGGKYTGNGVSTYNSFIGFPELSLVPGAVYLLKLDITSSDFRGTLSAYGNITCNSGPVCDSISYSTSDSLTTVTAENCTDSDNEDYPLLFQYGFTTKSNAFFWINEPVAYSSYSLYLAPGTKSLQVRVIDALSTSVTYAKQINHQTRQLSEDYLMVIIERCKTPGSTPNTIITFCKYEIDFASFSYLHSQFYSYFFSIPSSRFNADLFISCLSSILSKSSLITPEIIINCTELTIGLLSKYKYKMMTSMVNELLVAFDVYYDLIDPALMTKLLMLVSDRWVQETLPNVQLDYSNHSSIIKLRKIGLSYVGSQVSNSNFSVEFPKDLQIDREKMFDLVFIVQKGKGLGYINLFVKESGTYANYNLALKEVKDGDLKISSPIVLIVRNFIGVSAAKCSGSSGNLGRCMVGKVNSTHIQVEIYSKGQYTVAASEENCSLTRSPLLVSGAVFLFSIVLSILLSLHDRKSKPTPSRQFFLNLGISSLFIPQVNPKRAGSLLKITAGLLVLEASIGLTYTSIISESGFVTNFGTHFTSLELERGLIGLVVCQVFNLFNTLLFIGKNIKVQSYIGIFINLLTSLIALGCIAIICITSCPLHIIQWVINFAIFSVADQFVFNAVWALIASLLCKSRARKDTRVTSFDGTVKELQDLSSNETIFRGSLTSSRIFS